MAQSVYLWATGAGRLGFDSTAGATDFSVLLSVETGPGAHPGWAPLPWENRPGREADQGRCQKRNLS
jgi:hypothetical protein